MIVPVFDLTQQYATLREDLLPLLDDVMGKGHFILGEQVQLFEQEIAALLGIAHGVGVANGSDALHLALMACDIGPGDEVIVPAFTFFATAGAVARTGARPVIVDVDPETFNIDINCVARAISPRTRAIIPVHLYGQPAPMTELMALAAPLGIRVIEDAAQAIGARIGNRSVCSFGDFGTLSFFPTKNLGAFGDAGMVVCSNPELVERVRMLRVHGSKVKYRHEFPGYNSRLDELQAAILRLKLRHLPDWTARRRALAHTYDRLIIEAGLEPFVTVPVVRSSNFAVYHQYTIRVSQRTGLQRYLSDAGIGTAVYYPLPLHLQPVFKDLGYVAGSLPVSEALAGEVLSLPMFPELTLDQQEYVVAQMVSYYRGAKA